MKNIVTLAALAESSSDHNAKITDLEINLMRKDLRDQKTKGGCGRTSLLLETKPQSSGLCTILTRRRR